MTSEPLTITLTLAESLVLVGSAMRLDQRGDKSFRQNLGFNAEHYDAEVADEPDWSEDRAVTVMADPAWKWYMDADRLLEGLVIRNALRAAGHRAELFNNLLESTPEDYLPDYFLVTDYDLHPGIG